VLFWFMWRYDDRNNTEPVKFVHGSHSLEVVWTMLPAATLLFIAIYQMNAWASEKMDPPDMAPTVEVTGRQFEWRLRYPGADGELHTPDDVLGVNELHVPVGEELLLVIKSEDVLHSFFLPNMRLKQDIVPGMKQMMWFKCTQTGKFDIVCAELCGWGHYKMKGQVTVESRADFDAWLAEQYVLQMATGDPADEEE
jgi:cytochrome c oxidase subunit 2